MGEPGRAEAEEKEKEGAGRKCRLANHASQQVLCGGEREGAGRVIPAGLKFWEGDARLAPKAAGLRPQSDGRTRLCEGASRRRPDESRRPAAAQAAVFGAPRHGDSKLGYTEGFGAHRPWTGAPFWGDVLRPADRPSVWGIGGVFGGPW